METIQKELTTEERHERVITFLKRHMAEKRQFEQEMVQQAKARKLAREHTTQTGKTND
jgi:hypothetical protein